MLKSPFTTTPASDRTRHGFTAVEMLMVIMVTISLIGLAVPGIISAQRRVDANASMNVIRAVHDACSRNARQFGSACLIYGFTLEYTDGTVLNGLNSAAAIRPWLINASAAPQYHNPPQADFAMEIGHRDLWNGDRVQFIDAFRPSSEVILNGTPIPTAAAQYLHVAYEPRTGFIHAQTSSSPNPAFTANGPGGVALPGTMPDQLEIEIWSGGPANHTALLLYHHMSFNATGVLDVRDF